MIIKQNNPLQIHFEETDEEDVKALKKLLTYNNKSLEHQYKKLKNNRWAAKADPDWAQKVLELKQSIKKSLLFQDDSGLWTYSGLVEFIQKNLHPFINEEIKYINNVKYPDPKLQAWYNGNKPHEPRYYQKEAVEELLSNPHSSIQLPTGAGKAQVILTMAKSMGLRSIIVTPSVSIGWQIYNLFLDHLGKANVGFFGDGKKDFKKKYVVAIAASLASCKVDSEAYEHLHNRDVLIADESHLLPVESLSKIHKELCKDVPYRWSVSATQLRNDGADIYLHGLIGKIVYKKEYKELAEQGFLAPLRFRIIDTPSSSKYEGNNSKLTAQQHFLYNKNIIKTIGALATEKALAGEPVLILIDEIEQEAHLRPYLETNYLLATADTDVTKLVDRFNKGEVNILIGTSAIATGTDIRPTQHLCLAVYGSSIIKILQGIGRGTRLHPGKTNCTVWDFNVSNHGTCLHHLDKRMQIFASLSEDVKKY